MLTVVIVFLWASILLYVLLGGADFGAGIIELLSPSGEKKITRQLAFKAIGPIWEANHMWVVITVVILFVGFPDIYTVVSTYLYIPLFILLLGIVARGTALSFRANDAIRDDLQRLYSRVFVGASIGTPFVLGIIAGSFLSGSIHPSPSSFAEGFVYSWFNLFSITTGIFMTVLCAWLAAIYLVSRSDNTQDKGYFIHHAIIAHILLGVSGILVILAAFADHIPLVQLLSGKRLSLLSIGGAGLFYVAIWWSLRRQQSQLLSVLGVGMTVLTYFSITYGMFPRVVILTNETALSLTTPGNESSITALGWSLLVGSVLIFPSLGYLIYIFEGRTKETTV